MLFSGFACLCASIGFHPYAITGVVILIFTTNQWQDTSPEIASWTSGGFSICDNMLFNRVLTME